VLKVARENDCPWSPYDCTVAAGHLELIKWAIENGSGFDTDRASASAALGGRLDILKWIVKEGYQFDSTGGPLGVTNPYVCAQAALGGHLRVLKWLREQGYSWVDSTVRQAEKGGHTEILNWIRANAKTHDCSKPFYELK